MTTRPYDTSKAAWSLVEDGLRRMTPAERVQRSVSLSILAHSFALAQIRQQHPDEGDRLHRLRLAARYLDAATLRGLRASLDD